MIRIPAFVLAIGCMATATAFAADDRRTFESLDGDRDGFVSQSEVPADHPLARRFTAADTDRDGRLSRAEFEAYQSSSEPPVEEF